MNRRSAVTVAFASVLALSPLAACGSTPSAGAETRPGVSRGGNVHEHQAHRDVAEWGTDSATTGNRREHLAHQDG